MGESVTATRARARRDSYTVAEITIWGRAVGAVVENQLGEVIFEYAEDFRKSGLELSPIHLPLTRLGPISFPHLQRIKAFQGLPGVLADCLPDAFGNAVIKRYFEQKGTPSAAMSPVQRLLYIGKRAVGALEFSPAIDRIGAGADEALHIAKLVEEARRIIDGDTDVAVPEMMQVGASAGGARAKALILWNKSQNRVKSAFAPMAKGDEHWLLKFDGVTGGAGGHEMVKEFKPTDFGRIEFAYSQMARVAGIEMTETHLLREREFAHFMTRRFDRVGSDRIHMHSLGGLLHADYDVRQIVSYEEYFRTIRELGLGQPAIDQAFRRMVFNFAARNQDDHVKNIAFLMGPDGKWTLSPAFDVMWAYGGNWSASHNMTALGKDDGFTREDLLEVGRTFDVPENGAQILEDVEAALERWEPEAKDAGVSIKMITQIQRLFRHFA